MIYVNHVGAQTDLIFDGGSLAVSAGGHVFLEMPYFEEALHIIELEKLKAIQVRRT